MSAQDRALTIFFLISAGERRKRGRPRKTWMEGVRAAMKTRHLEADQWLNRKEWFVTLVIQSNSCTIHTLKHNHFNI